MSKHTLTVNKYVNGWTSLDAKNTELHFQIIVLFVYKCIRFGFKQKWILRGFNFV